MHKKSIYFPYGVMAKTCISPEIDEGFNVFHSKDEKKHRRFNFTSRLYLKDCSLNVYQIYIKFYQVKLIA